MNTEDSVNKISERIYLHNVERCYDLVFNFSVFSGKRYTYINILWEINRSLMTDCSDSSSLSLFWDFEKWSSKNSLKNTGNYLQPFRLEANPNIVRKSLSLWWFYSTFFIHFSNKNKSKLTLHALPLSIPIAMILSRHVIDAGVGIILSRVVIAALYKGSSDPL